MTELQIKYFLKLADCKSFKKAAAELGISQPALSKHIALLERDLGMRLFERTMHTVHLTTAGRIMEQAFSRALREVRDGLNAAQKLTETATDTLRVGIMSSWSINRFKNQLGVDFHADKYLIYHMPQEDLLQELFGDNLDVMFAFQGNLKPDPLLEQKIVMQSRCCFMLPQKEFPLAAGKEYLAGKSILIGNYSGITDSIIQSIQQEHGFAVTTVFYPTVETIALDIQNGKGIGLMSDLSILYERAGFVYPDAGAAISVVAVTTSAGVSKPRVADFLTCLGK